MPKKRKLTPHEIEIYRKRHPSEHAIEDEGAKIRREMASFVQLRRKNARRIRRCLDEHGNPGEDLEIQQYEESALRELRNAAAHKRRLAGLPERTGALNPGKAPPRRG